MEVAGHVMKILPRLKFVKGVSVSCVSFNIVKSSLIDNLVEVKLTFIYSVVSELELFLTIFQSEVPMSPFLYDFFLVSQSVRQGTVSPTSYNVIFDTLGLPPDRLQRLTYKFCHLYFNWSWALVKSVAYIMRSIDVG
ncbi:hypothetical protein PR048_008914 [Dryococelus australis]|uniref:Piwi domain-containing protein n=1 Tax=Dryococelus australis TaxID=614101 RepID=A0ABQ9HYG1_9NEOP|nr:hypothetical protein PR048_008914 [Dryococelus australis]